MVKKNCLQIFALRAQRCCAHEWGTLVNTLIGDINMAEIYLLAKIRNTVTGQTQKVQDLTGHRWSLREAAQAQEFANAKAAEFTQRTGQSWTGFLERYTPTYPKD